MSKKIVSANYLDRKSPFKWLVREAGQDPEQAQPFKVVKATGVVFTPSDKDEIGFGCTVVASCATAEGYNDQVPFTKGDLVGSTPLTFDGLTSFYDNNKKEITSLETMYLTEDGAMCGYEKASEEVSV